MDNKTILVGKVNPPPEAQPLIAQLNRYSPREEGNKPIESRAADAVGTQADRPKDKKK